MDINEVVGGMGSESTWSLNTLAVPTLVFRLGVLAFGLGLALRLAARVAAMKLGLLGSMTRALGCRYCWL
jgi:hypothetical protein